MGWISVMGWFFGSLAVCAFVSDEVLPRIEKRVRGAKKSRLP